MFTLQIHAPTKSLLEKQKKKKKEAEYKSNETSKGAESWRIKVTARKMFLSTGCMTVGHSQGHVTEDAPLGTQCLAKLSS